MGATRKSSGTRAARERRRTGTMRSAGTGGAEMRTGHATPPWVTVAVLWPALLRGARDAARPACPATPRALADPRPWIATEAAQLMVMSGLWSASALSGVRGGGRGLRSTSARHDACKVSGPGRPLGGEAESTLAGLRDPPPRVATKSKSNKGSEKGGVQSSKEESQDRMASLDLLLAAIGALFFAAERMSWCESQACRRHRAMSATDSETANRPGAMISTEASKMRKANTERRSRSALGERLLRTGHLGKGEAASSCGDFGRACPDLRQLARLHPKSDGGLELQRDSLHSEHIRPKMGALHRAEPSERHGVFELPPLRTSRRHKACRPE